MIPEINKIKGIHPGAILRREINSLGIKGKDFANKIGEYSQTLSAVLNERRSINPLLSIKIGKELGIDNDYFMILQASYDVQQKQKENSHRNTPNLDIIRKVLFWDTNFDEIDWIKNKRAVIRRVFERGNEIEIKEIIRFYGKDNVRNELLNMKRGYLDSFNSNIDKYIND